MITNLLVNNSRLLWVYICTTRRGSALAGVTRGSKIKMFDPSNHGLAHLKNQ